MRIAFLNLREHPRGNHVLRSIVAAGFVPELLIEEDSSLAAKNAAAWASGIDDVALCPSTDRALGDLPVERFIVDNHNDEKVRTLLKNSAPDLVVLGDARVLHPRIFETPSRGCLNIHPGYLPTVRGNTPYLWAAALDLPQGCSAHFVDEGIDTGPVLLRRRLTGGLIRSYADLLRRIHVCCGELAVAAVLRIADGRLTAKPQHSLTGAPARETFPLAPEPVRAQALARIRSGYGLPDPADNDRPDEL